MKANRFVHLNTLHGLAGALLSLVASHALCQNDFGGKLPAEPESVQATPPKVTPKMAKPVDPKSLKPGVDANFDCESTIGTSLLTALEIVDDSTFFALVPVSKAYVDEASTAKDDPTSALSWHILYRVQWADRRIEQVLALKALAPASVMLYGSPPSGAYIATFDGVNIICGEGAGVIVRSVFEKLTSRDVMSTRSVGQFALMRGDGTPLLADLAKRGIFMLDAVGAQSRRVFEFPMTDRPLYYSPATRRLVTMLANPTRLREYAGGQIKTPTSELRITPDQRVLQQDSLFAVAQSMEKIHRVIIHESETWTGHGRSGDFDIEPPSGLDWRHTGVAVSLTKQMLVLSGNSPMARKRWRRIYVYNYGTSTRPLRVIEPGEGTYIGGEWFDGSGRTLIMTFFDMQTDKAISFKILNVLTGGVYDIPLPKPQ